MRNIVLTLIKFYKNFLSQPVKIIFGGGCRFMPTCSDYAYDAVEKYGFLKGTILAGKRVIKCNAFTPTAFDPVK